MKKLLVGSFILFLSANVFAGEVSQYAGPYAGLHFGYSQGDSKGYETDTGVANGTTADKGSLSKYIFGGDVGYNKSISNNFILGIEADFENRNAKNMVNLMQPDGNPWLDTVETKIQSAYSVRLRVGRVFNDDKTMVFLTGGFAAADISKSYTITGLQISQSKWQSGYTTGLGIEHFINNSFSVKSEYRYSDYGKSNLDVGAIIPGFSEHSKYENEHSVRFGLMYHF